MAAQVWSSGGLAQPSRCRIFLAGFVMVRRNATGGDARAPLRPAILLSLVPDELLS